MRNIAALILFFSLPFQATADKVYLVGGDKEKGKAAAEKVDGKWVKSLTKAFAKAAADLEAGGEMTVTIKLAAGEYKGDLGSGAYDLPIFNNEKARLHIIGGFSPNFSKRKPFKTPSRIVTVPDRSAPLWKFAKRSKLAAFVVDGLHFDAVASNKYDAMSNSLLKGTSSTHVYIKFNYLETNHLEFSNCVFANSPHRVMETLIRAATPEAQIRFHNDIFINCVIPLKLDTARFRNKPKKIEVSDCSFILNWAYNPDPNTGNPAALELGPKDAANEIVITNSLFYANFGGAILALHKQLPALTLNNNNFVGNGLLHNRKDSDAVAMIVIAGGKKQDLTPDLLEDVPAVDEAEDNVSVAPGIPIVLGEVQTVDASKIKAEKSWTNEVNRLLGKNLAGGRINIRNYAPPLNYTPSKPPVATSSEGKKYGASPKKAK